jgi:PmbA protein
MQIEDHKTAQYKNIVIDVLALAKKHGATAADVMASMSTGLSVNIRKQEVDTIEFDCEKGLGITAYYGKHRGSASTSDFSTKAIEETVIKACSLAKIMAEDIYCGLADRELMAQDYIDLDLYHPWDLEPEQAKRIALECESYGLGFSDKITNSDGASVSTSNSLLVYGNTNNFIGAYKGSRHNISCVLIAAAQDKMQRDYYYTTSRLSDHLENIKIVGQRAASKTLAKLNPQGLKTQKAKVLFSPEMARGLFGSFVSAISGNNLYRESSFLLNKLNHQVFSDCITMIEDPLLKQGLASTAFDSEGVKTSKRELITNGILNGYIMGSYSARRLGMQTTGNAGGAHNLLVGSGKKMYTQEEIIANMGSGLLVTAVMGQGVNIVTGDYSRGASGFWIENGKIAYPVEGITIAGNLKEMFMNIEALGKDIDQRGGIQTGSLLIDGMMIAGS